MFPLLAQVLDDRDLSKAGDLFAVSDKCIQDDLSEAIKKIEEIATSPDYLANDNDQSVVEICITRVTSAIRETETIEAHLPALVSLLKSCLKYELKPSERGEDPPHAKIASDVMSSVFLNYSKKRVMELTVSVAVQFLNSGNKDLCRNVSSYLSLAAIDNSHLLAKEVEPVVRSIISGNKSLIRILPQIYPENQEPIRGQITALINLLLSLDQSETTSLLQLLLLIVQDKPKLLHPHVDKLTADAVMSSCTSTTVVLQIFTIMAKESPSLFIDYTTTLQDSVKKHNLLPTSLAPILSAVGRLSVAQGKSCVKFLVSQLSVVDSPHTVAALLQEVKSVAECHKEALDGQMDEISKHSDSSMADARLLVQKIKEIFARSSQKELRSTSCQTEGTVTVITVGNPPPTTQSSITVSAIPLNSRTVNGGHDAAGAVRSKIERPHSAMTVSSTHSTRTAYSVVTNNSVGSQGRDAVQQFCEKHHDKIKKYIQHVSARLPLPFTCSISEHKRKCYLKVHFKCQADNSSCLYRTCYFTIKSKQPKIWLHLMFLRVQANADVALGQTDNTVCFLKSCLELLRMDGGFSRLVTSSFPSTKDQDVLLQELQSVRFFDVFQFNAASNLWSCFLCNHPEKASGLLQNGDPVIEGQLKEKKRKWRIFRHWKTRYYTLSGANITYSTTEQKSDVLPLGTVQSVKAIRRGKRDIPKAFEIFTDEQKYVLKAKDTKNAEQWVQCLHLAVAKSHDGKEPGRQTPASNC